MDDSERPPLGAETYEEIEGEQYGVHQKYWSLLQDIRGPSIAGILATTGPPPPKRPIKLSKILAEYACALFDVEAKRYHNQPQLPTWLKKLSGRTEHLVMTHLAEMQKPGALDFGSITKGSLTYHATWEQMRKAINEALSAHAIEFAERSATSQSASPSVPVPTLPKSDGKPEARPLGSNTEVTQHEGDEKKRRRALLDEYRAATGKPSNRRIYQARNSGIHKPQFYEWIKGVLSNESETSKNFERFLREKKPPTPRKPRT
jgi:hypothetical protein